jgi:hypothetical protein
MASRKRWESTPRQCRAGSGAATSKHSSAAPRVGEQQNGDIYLIRESDVRRFILEHPTEIDLRKVDQLWFLDLITNGLVCSV